MKHIKLLIKILIVLLIPLATSALAKGGSNNGETRVEGNIQQINSEIIEVSNTIFLLSNSTKYEDSNGNHVSLSFFNIGDLVKVRAIPSGGDLLATKVELEVHNSGDDSNGGSNDDSNSDKNGNDDNKNSSKGNKTLLKSKLNGDETSSKGKVKKFARLQNNRTRDRIQIKVHVPIPSTIPLLPSRDDVSSLNLMAIFSRADVPYASCTLVFDEVERKSSGLVAEFKTDIRLRTREGREDRLRVKKGSCDTDITTDDTEQGVPSIELGDTIEIVEIIGDSQNSFLSGNF
ncbi:MAG: hypothetical protein KDD56_08075 [Bdellovibrionales bacterium]|nr:hypothetical protein [Bdellovibrionales bacterium]